MSLFDHQMDGMDVTLAHVAVGANAASNALSGNRALHHCVGTDASVACAAYAAKNSVAIVTRDSNTPSLLTIKNLLPHRHTTRDATRITSVYLHAPSLKTEASRVLAGDSEGHVLLWISSSDRTWSLQSLQGPNGDKVTNDAVSAVTAVRTQRRWLYLVAFSSGHVAVWQHQHDEHEVKCLVVQALGVRMILETLAATASPHASQEEEDVLVAGGGVDSKVHLFEIARGTETLTSLLALEGHRGWIRSVDFATTDASSPLLLASASQDHRVRLWKITVTDRDALTATTNAGFLAKGVTALYTINFDALLIAHEDWVTSVVWTQLPLADALWQPALVSTSMDNTVILWTKQTATGVWMPSLRVGEHGGNGVLASAVLPSPDTRVDLLALSLAGQLDRWLQQPAPSKTFLPAPSLMGHTAPVTDLAWSPRGDYIISLSLDQTTRVLAPWHANQSWLEISRAQVHGHDLNCGVFLSTSQLNDRFVSGADEKILRVFEAPDDLQTLVQAMQDVRVDNIPSKTDGARVEHAYLPELSLTNKSTDKKAEKGSNKPSLGAYATLGDAEHLRLPVGDTLAKKTLWPELRKLYGHGNELLCVASNHTGTLVASACKSREEKFAAVWLWRTNDWSAAQLPLEGHKSSVVQLAFSPNDEHLVSVSKDRHFCVFTQQSDGSYTLTDRLKAHKRIIWSCSWAPDSTVFVTGARDQTIAFWGATLDDKWTQRGTSITMESAVTAVAFAPQALATNQYILAVGLENGAIFVYTVTSNVMEHKTPTVVCSLVATIPRKLTPTATISRLSWTPSSTDNTIWQLACASADHTVRLYNVRPH